MKRLTEKALATWSALPPSVTRIVAHTASLATGLLVAVCVHYVLYRLGLPSKPFIYVSF